MELKGKHVGLAVTGSFCTFAKIEQEIRHLKAVSYTHLTLPTT